MLCLCRCALTIACNGNQDCALDRAIPRKVRPYVHWKSWWYPRGDQGTRRKRHGTCADGNLDRRHQRHRCDDQVTSWQFYGPKRHRRTDRRGREPDPITVVSCALDHIRRDHCSMLPCLPEWILDAPADRLLADPGDARPLAVTVGRAVRVAVAPEGADYRIPAINPADPRVD